MAISPAVRQLIVAVSSGLAALCVGGAVGYPAVLLRHFHADTSIPLDIHTTSWIGSIHGVAGIPSILMPSVMQWRGRKFAFMAACLVIIAGWVVACCAVNVTMLLVSEVFHGFGTNSVLAVSLLSMSEMVTPRYRNVSMLSFSIVQSLGMAVVGIMGQYLHWRVVGAVMCVPIVLALLASFLWTESPSWLACKGRYDQCERVFLCLRGDDDTSKKELTDLINSQKQQTHVSLSKTLFVRKLLRRDLYVPSVHMFVLLNAMYWSGTMVVLIYSSRMLGMLTSDPSGAHLGGILVNCILFVCFTITGLLIRRFKHKAVLTTSLLCTAVCLLATSGVSYCQTVGLLASDSLLSLYCLLAYMTCSSLGLNSIVFTVAAELMPVRYRGLGGALFVIYTCILHTTSLKISPYLFLYLNMWGTCLIFALNALLSCWFIHKYVPETKGRTLQEIEDWYARGTSVRTDFN